MSHSPLPVGGAAVAQSRDDASARLVDPARGVYAAAATAGVIAFFAVFDLPFLLGRGPFWQNPGADTAANLVGLRYFLAEPWRFPLFGVKALNFPAGANIVFTDSIPLAAGLAKLAGAGPSLNYLGLWLLICWTLQPAAAIYALRGLGVRGAVPQLAAGGLSLLMPAWLARADHIALCSHFLLLVALGLCFRAAGRSRGGFLGSWALLLTVALLVHPYLMAMCAALFCAAAADRVRPDLRALPVEAAGVLAVFAGLAVVMLVGGHFSAAGKGPVGFGVYSMNLLSPVWPQRSALFPAAPALDATGGQYEGLNYLGAGLLLLLAAALPRPRRLAAALRRRWPLTLVLLGLAGFSLSWRVTAGPAVLVDLGPAPELLEQFRSTGRFFWPAGYALLIGAVAGVASAFRPAHAGALLAAALFLQAADGSALLRELSAKMRRGEPAAVDLAAWQALTAAHRKVEIFPSYPCADDGDRPRLGAVIFAASAAVVPVNTAYVNRADTAACRFPLEPLAPEDATLAVFAHPAGAARLERPFEHCRLLDGLTACTAFWPKLRLPGSPAPRPFDFAALYAPERIRFAEPGSAPFLLDGWSGREAWGVWSDGSRAVLVLAAERPVVKRAVLRFRVFPPPEAGGQSVTVSVDGVPAAEWSATEWPATGGGAGCCVRALPLRLGPDRPTVIAFEIARPAAPAALGSGNDPRRLGIGLIELELAATPE